MQGNKMMTRITEKAAWSRIQRLEAIVLVLVCLLLGYAFSSLPGDASAEEPATANSATAEAAEQDKDYSHFQHANATHSRLPCLLCHRRDDNSGRISFPGKPGHLPCAGCHALQFQDNTSPICTICHTSTGMKRFPGLKSFSARFDHGRHLRVNCATCHRTANKGVALSIPSGPNAHNTCFQCHTSTAAAEMSSCSTCHTPGRPNWTSEWVRSYRLSFSHAKHVGRAGQNCATCHTIKPGASRGRQVTQPLASMHFAPARSISCGGCHNGQKAFGPDDFSNCKRCHQGNSFKF